MVIFPKQRIKLPELVNLSLSFHKRFLLKIILYSKLNGYQWVIWLVHFEEEASLAKLFSCDHQTIPFYSTLTYLLSTTYVIKGCNPWYTGGLLLSQDSHSWITSPTQ